MEITVGVSEGTTDYFNVNAQIARFEGVKHFNQPSYSREQGQDRTVFEDLLSKVTSQQILMQDNEELQTYWTEFLQVNKSKPKAVDTVKKFLGGFRQVSKGYMDKGGKAKRP